MNPAKLCPWATKALRAVVNAHEEQYCRKADAVEVDPATMDRLSVELEIPGAWMRSGRPSGELTIYGVPVRVVQR